MSGLKQGAIIIAITVIAFAGTLFLHKPSDQLYQGKPKVLPPKTLKHAHFGFRLVMSDLMWIRVLQNDDFCESPRKKASFNPGISLEDAMKAKLEPSRCHKGWVFQMFDLITDLNPHFDWVYSTGGLMLSIGVDDREGARVLFEKGIQRSAEDWQLLYRAAYHYIFEIQDQKRAAQLLSLATLIPHVPHIVHILAARLEKAEGRHQMARDTLVEYLKTAKKGSEGYAYAMGRLIQLDAEMAQMKEKELKKSRKKSH